MSYYPSYPGPPQYADYPPPQHQLQLQHQPYPPDQYVPPQQYLQTQQDYGGYPQPQPQYQHPTPQNSPYGYPIPHSSPQSYPGSSQSYNNGFDRHQPPDPGYGLSHSPDPSIGGPAFQGLPTTYPNPSSYDQGNHHAPPPPPSHPVAFGHGAPQGYNFQYSSCTGRRKALLIGINYFNQKGQLRGCINDVKNMSAYLSQSFGYVRDDMVILTDDQQNPMSQPTKANILRAMHWLVKDAQPNDSLFFHYSGHGGQTPDLEGDENDGYDEVIYPVDFRVSGHIVDDEMHRIMVKPLQAGVRLTAIFDSCHSGSALDLPYIYSTKGLLKEPDLAKEAGQGLLSVASAWVRGDMSGMISSALGFVKSNSRSNTAFEKTRQTRTSPADVIMWSGSKDAQTSRDAVIDGQATGAMSWAFITALKKNPQQSYVQLLNNIRDEMAGKYGQKPQLSSSHPLDTELRYVM